MFNFCWILSSMYYLWKQQHQQQQKQATCVMDAWEVLHLVLKIFPSFSGQTGSKVLLLLFMCKEMPKYFLPSWFCSLERNQFFHKSWFQPSTCTYALLFMLSNITHFFSSNARLSTTKQNYTHYYSCKCKIKDFAET